MTIENLYWILYQTLLKPVGLDCYYYHPWGTKDHLSCNGEFKSWKIKSEHHVLFHFDQEPLWNNSLGSLYDTNPTYHGWTWSSKLLRILANSEYSQLKKNICKDRNMMDWYFFYHGLAALDWFADSRFFDQIQPISKIYSSYNHLVRYRRCYRIALTAKLAEINLLPLGDISFHGNRNDVLAEINDSKSQLTNNDKHTVAQYLIDIDLDSLRLDRQSLDGRGSAHFGHHEYKLWQRSFVHLVNETVFYESKLHLTEKTFKPVVAMRPFILVAAPGNLAYLRSYGFQTFNTWIDESYDDIQDPTQRLDSIVQEVNRLCAMPMSAIQKIYQDMQPVLQHNKRHFFGDFRKIIINELVDNFDTCVRLWNNGRVDGRELPMHPDLESVRHLLLQ